MKQSIRIIGGKYRGKKITFPDNQTLRPTPDRVRETLFNWLMHHIPGARCLDAFAGSGALGIEAFSRGAAQVYFLEKNKATYQHLQGILADFDSSILHISHIHACEYLLQTNETFDIIFLDPPFQSHLLSECLTILKKRALLSTKGFVYIESSSEIPLDLTAWDVMKQKVAGQVHYALLKDKVSS